VSFEPISQEPLILLVEDNEDDVLLIRRGFERAEVRNPFRVVTSGVEAIAYLNGDQPYWDRAKNPLPALVLLDIKMPMTDGFAVLKWIRRQPELARLCVVMLTSSDEIRDVNLAYHLGANSFFVKPLDFWNAAELWRAVQRLLARRECLSLSMRPEPRSDSNF
jgi:CheY-like chemotaxis protein